MSQPVQTETKQNSSDEDFQAYKQNVARLEKSMGAGRSYSAALNDDIPFLLGINTPLKTNGIPEAQEFEQKFEAMRKKNTCEVAFADVRMALPSFPSAVEAKEFKKGIVLSVHFLDNKIQKTLIPLKPESTCDELIATVVTKLNARHNTGLDERNISKYVFKALGSSEYFYGTSRFYNYEFVDKTIKNNVISIPVVFMETTTALEKCTHPVDSHLKAVSYDIGFEEEKADAYDHNKISFGAVSWDKVQVISLWDLHRAFRVKVRSLAPLQKLPEGFTSDAALYACVELMYGGEQLTPARFTKAVPTAVNPMWNQLLTFDIMTSELPREATLCFTVFATKQTATDVIESVGSKDVPVCFIKCPLFDYKRQLKTGLVSVRMWEDARATPEKTLYENVEGAIALSFELDKYHSPVVFPTGDLPKAFDTAFANFEQQQKRTFANVESNKLQEKIKTIVNSDPLYKLTPEDKFIIWENREQLKSTPKALPKFLLSVPARYPTARKIASELASSWSKFSSTLDYLQFLDYKYADTSIRRLAVRSLSTLSDPEVSDFTLQFVQAMKFEICHDSAVVRFLLERAVRNNHVNGHALFWALRSEMHAPEARLRNFLVLSEYLRACEKHRAVLAKQIHVVDMIIMIAMKVKNFKEEERRAAAQNELKKLVLPAPFTLPINPRAELQSIKVEKCRVMSSKKAPVWVVFQNAENGADDSNIIFKAGDDLRQDLLTLQVLKIMDGLWKKEGMDLHIIPYGCVTTGDMQGLIEVVTRSDTISSITFGSGGALKALSGSPLKEWLSQKYKEEARTTWEDVVDNFVRSTAGYSVATYTLGIGDRHNSNIMLRKNGDLFHIDFGHFLGNFKTFAGIKRETTPFVFTAMYSEVMGGKKSPQFARYRDLACQAFAVLRKNADLLINMFLLMIPTGIPELTGEEDVEHIRNSLVLSRTEEEAKDFFKFLIKLALQNVRVRVGEMIHIMAHNKLTTQQLLSMLGLGFLFKPKKQKQ